MATKDNNPGLLSKVAKFVRNPTTNWTDLDKQDPEPDAGYSKQALKEMIERKRQNDFVRRREFDQLRKLRNRDPSALNPDLAGRPSYFQSSLPSNPGERAMTIKKIDEIEAQMSNQWWQGKNDGAKAPGAAESGTAAPAAGASAPPAGTPGVAAKTSDTGYPATKLSPMRPESGYPATKLSPMSPESSYAPTRLSPMRPESGYAPTKLSPMLPESSIADRPDFAATQPISGFGAHARPSDASLPDRNGKRSGVAPAPVAKARDISGFSHSQSFAVELTEGVTDPDLEEAAIRFANGDNAGAERGLLEALEGADVRRDLAQIWTSALFDLYRATGQQARFDSVAIDYAERFGRSAPAWFSMPELLGIKSAKSIARTLPSQLQDEPLWTSPAVFDRASFDELQLSVANAGSPWFVDWSQIAMLEPDAAEQLGQLFNQWCTTAVQLRFKGSQSLERVLRSCTPSGDKAVSPSRWKLRMDALRIMRLQDEFELVALDYCVTYEVSPPAWADARCGYFQEPGNGGEAIAADSELDDMADQSGAQGANNNMPTTVPMGLDTGPAAVVELSGEILGEATESLARLEEARQDADRLVISCANLIRVDFSAAGSILNWVAMRQAEGCHLQFRDVHHLVAAFFNVIGINEHARVVVRSN